MDTQESLREIENLRLRFRMNNRLRLESLAALSKLFREHGEPLSDELLASMVFAVPEELNGGNGHAQAAERPGKGQRMASDFPPPLNVPPTDVPPVDVPPADVPPSAYPPTEFPPPSAVPPPTDFPPPAEFPPPSEVPPVGKMKGSSKNVPPPKGVPPSKNVPPPDVPPKKAPTKNVPPPKNVPPSKSDSLRAVPTPPPQKSRKR